MPVVHWEITAKDSHRLEHFYREMFDWNVAAGPFATHHVDTRTPSGIPGTITATEGSWPTGAFFYVQVDDIRQYLDKAEQLGATTLLPPTTVADTATIAIFRDPEGVRVGLVQR
jgi:predicted enzyme related to lactoylglutathione lyase